MLAPDLPAEPDGAPLGDLADLTHRHALKAALESLRIEFSDVADEALLYARVGAHSSKRIAARLFMLLSHSGHRRETRARHDAATCCSGAGTARVCPTTVEHRAHRKVPERRRTYLNVSLPRGWSGR
jgi:hypothetical protein